MKKIILALLFLTLIFNFISCEDNPTKSNLFPTEMIPLKMGNSWSYVRTNYDSTGIVEYTENITSTIDKDTLIDELTWYGYSDTPSGIWFTNKSNGYWVYARWNNGNAIVDTMLLIYKYPAIVGDVFDFPSFRREVVSTNELITVPAGSYKTIHYSDTFLDSSNYLLDSFEIFVAQGIGLIKRVQIGRKQDGTRFMVFEEELENYSLH
jgi:hypothetical protein